MFASPSNSKLPKFVSRWPHHRALLVNALTCPLSQLTEVYAHPPWSILQQWLVPFRDNPLLLSLAFSSTSSHLRGRLLRSAKAMMLIICRDVPCFGVALCIATWV